MQGNFHHTGRSRLAVVLLASGLTAACSTYHPLDRGSNVPWANAASPRQVVQAAAVSDTAGAAWAQAAGTVAGGYRVRPGDRLSTLAGRFGVTVRALADANQLEAPYVIYVGQALRIPGATAVAAAREPAVAILGARYVVRHGDTLSSIARRADVSLVQLAAANGIAAPYEVYAGQRLRIPAAGEVAAAPAPAKATLAVHTSGKAPPLSGDGFLWPVNGKVIGGFGPTASGQRRDGIDIAAREGAPVLAAEAGVVAYAGDGIRTLGRLILIRHADGYITTYAHNAALLVAAGDAVARGQVIARVGSSGDVTRSQLHFEIRKGRQPIDPETVLVHEPTAVASTQ